MNGFSFRTFVADLTGGRLLCLKDEIGWASFRSLRQRFKEVDPFLDSYDDLDEGVQRGAGIGQAGMGGQAPTGIRSSD